MDIHSIFPCTFGQGKISFIPIFCTQINLGAIILVQSYRFQSLCFCTGSSLREKPVQKLMYQCIQVILSSSLNLSYQLNFREEERIFLIVPYIFSSFDLHRRKKTSKELSTGLLSLNHLFSNDCAVRFCYRKLLHGKHC